MQTLHFIKTQPFLPKPSSLFKPTIPNPHIPLQTLIFTPRSHLSPLSDQTHIPKPITNARKKRAANGSLKFQKLLLRLVPIVASNLRVLPPPLDQIWEAINGGDGGGGRVGVWKGLGGGGFDGFGGKKKKRKGFYLLVLSYVVLVSCGVGLLCCEELERSNWVWFGLCLGGFGVGLVNLWEKSGGYFGGFALGVLVGLGFNKRKELREFGVLKLRAVIESVVLRRGRKRSTRRAF